MNTRPKVRPSLWYCSIGVAVILAGTGGFAYEISHFLSHLLAGLTQLVVPGEKDINLAAKTKYTIFHEEQTILNGQFYGTTKDVDGLTCTISSAWSDENIPLRQPRASTSYEIGERHGKSMLEFTTTAAGAYRFGCEYSDGRDGPQIVLAIGPDGKSEFFPVFAKSFAFMFFGISVGMGLIAVVIGLREQSKMKLRHQLQAQPASTSSRV
jgi:hypothetical protein